MNIRLNIQIVVEKPRIMEVVSAKHMSDYRRIRIIRCFGGQAYIWETSPSLFKTDIFLQPQLFIVSRGMSQETLNSSAVALFHCNTSTFLGL